MQNGLWLWAMMISTQVGAIEAPVAVSPASEKGLALIESRCPTFSWSSVAAAKSYELSVFRVDDQGRIPNGTPPMLRSELPASSNSWTPSLDQCLQRGAFYAWTIRAHSGAAVSAWSPLRAIEVSPGIEQAEFERALAVVERYLQ